MFVRLARYLILALCILIIAALAGVAVFDPFSQKITGLGLERVDIDGSRIAMVRPVLSGYSRDGKPYILHAAKAIQDVRQPGKVELEGIDADMVSSGNAKLHMTAKHGVYESQVEHMDVSGGVSLKNDAYDVQLQSASLDFRSSLYRSDEPVVIKITGGTDITADSIIAADGGKLLTLVGRVHSTMAGQPPAETEKDKQ